LQDLLLKQTKKEKKMKKVSSLTILFAVLVMFSSVCGAAEVKKSTCPAGLTGTWVGAAGSDIRWLATHTSDSLDPTKGEMIMNWTYISPNFPGSSKSGVTLTPGHGVWQLNAEGNYDYTWYAYALYREDVTENDAIIHSAGDIAGTFRVSGVAMMQDFNEPPAPNCDIAQIYYHFDRVIGEVFPTDTDVTFYEGPKGWAAEVRVPLTVTPLP
jgi:hypothetical protein